ncbi:MAG TPA: hypothetical protein VIH90_06940 [Candidatus Saccharimonadales bacterium]
MNNSTATGNGVTSQAISLPSGISVGDMLITQVSYFRGGTGSNVTAPTGWTQLSVTAVNGFIKQAVYYHLHSGGDPSSYTWTFSRSSYVLLSMQDFSGVNPTNPADVFNYQTNTSTTAQNSPSVNTTFVGDMVLPLFTYGGGESASSWTSGYTASSQIYLAAGIGQFSGYKTFTSPGATGAVLTNIPLAEVGIGFTLALQATSTAIGVHYFGVDTPIQCNSSCTSFSPAVPTGYQTGDLLITSLAVHNNIPTAATLTAPSGWTQINTTGTAGTTGEQVSDFYHVVLAGDPSSYTWTYSAAIPSGIVTTSDYNGEDTANPIDVSAMAGLAKATTHTLPSITTTYAEDYLVGIWGYNAAATDTAITGTLTSVYNVKNTSSDGTTSAYVQLGSAGAIGTYTTTTTSTFTSANSIAIKALRSTPTLVNPASSITDVSLFPVFNLYNASLSSTPLQYKIQLCSNSTCTSVISTYDQTSSQTGWSGQDQLSSTAYFGSSTESSSTVAIYTQQTALTPGTTYYWRGYSYETGTSEWSNASNIYSFKTSYIPAAPTLYSPASGATNVPSETEFQLASTDGDGDPLEYKIQICSDAACATVLYTFDETSSQTGWSGQDSNSFTAYGSDPSLAVNSTPAYFDYNPGQLTPNTTYYWRAYAINPATSTSWSSASSIHGFTINTAETRIVNGTIENSTIL